MSRHLFSPLYRLSILLILPLLVGCSANTGKSVECGDHSHFPKPEALPEKKVDAYADSIINKIAVELFIEDFTRTLEAGESLTSYMDKKWDLIYFSSCSTIGTTQGYQEDLTPQMIDSTLIIPTSLLRSDTIGTVKSELEFSVPNLHYGGDGYKAISHDPIAHHFVIEGHYGADHLKVYYKVHDGIVKGTEVMYSFEN